MSGPGVYLRALTLFGAIVSFASANAQNLSWHFEQIYSNPDGNIQFVVLYEYGNNPNQNSLVGSQFISVHNDTEHAHDPGYVTTFDFPNNLPSTATGGRRFLIGTQGFADLGIITPDYVVENQFVPQKSGVLDFYKVPALPYDIVIYPGVPSDGANALYRDAPNQRQNLAINFAGQTASVPATPVASPTALAVEYYYADWNYYFMTSFPDEIALLDGGGFGGVWKRTGEAFKVWTQGSATSPAACRFFSTKFAPKSSHFYTPFAAECVNVKNNPDWQFESIAFFLQLTDANGNCGTGTMPLYRLYNNGMGGAPNHRYTTSLAVFNQMVGAGWVFEGNGNTKVFACVPQ